MAPPAVAALTAPPAAALPQPYASRKRAGDNLAKVLSLGNPLYADSLPDTGSLPLPKRVRSSVARAGGNGSAGGNDSAGSALALVGGTAHAHGAAAALAQGGGTAQAQVAAAALLQGGGTGQPHGAAAGQTQLGVSPVLAGAVGAGLQGVGGLSVGGGPAQPYGAAAAVAQGGDPAQPYATSSAHAYFVAVAQGGGTAQAPGAATALTQGGGTAQPQVPLTQGAAAALMSSIETKIDMLRGEVTSLCRDAKGRVQHLCDGALENQQQELGTIASLRTSLYHSRIQRSQLEVADAMKHRIWDQFMR